MSETSKRLRAGNGSSGGPVVARMPMPADFELTGLQLQPLAVDAVLPVAGPLWLAVLGGAVELATADGVVRLDPGDAAWLDARTGYRVTAVRTADLATADLRATHSSHRLPSPLVVREFARRHTGVAALIGSCPLDGTCSPSVFAHGYANLLGAAMVDSWLQDQGRSADGTGQSDPVIAAVIGAVTADPAKPWTAASMAAVAHLSRSTLGERFRKALGRSPAQMLREVRMGQARRLLADPSHHPVEFVASSVGYGSSAAFSRAFAGQHEGRSPQAWRAQTRGDRNTAKPPALTAATAAPTINAVLTP